MTLDAAQRATLLEGLCSRVDVICATVEKIERSLDFLYVATLGRTYDEIYEAVHRVEAGEGPEDWLALLMYEIVRDDVGEYDLWESDDQDDYGEDE